jgi:hypothetical protein
MTRFLIVVLPILFIFSQKLAGQLDSSNSKTFSGIIVDDSLGSVLPFVHIWNESARKHYFSNDSGEFSLRVKGQDTLVFTTLGYMSKVYVVSSSSLKQKTEVRLRPKIYEIGEVVVRRFRSYESFKYQVLNLDLPETGAEQAQEFMHVTAAAVALDADRERAVADKISTGRFGYTTQLGKGIDREKAFKKKIMAQEKREKVIAAKFNRLLVADLTQLEGDELTEFIAYCNFSEDYLYKSDLYTITDSLYAMFSDFQMKRDTIPSHN